MQHGRLDGQARFIEAVRAALSTATSSFAVRVMDPSTALVVYDIAGEMGVQPILQ